MRIALDQATTPEAFCTALKRAREARCISLREISESTKIAVNHLSALERADLRHWPKGIYRRAYFRDYARAVGLPEDAIDGFLRFFGDGEEAARGRAAEAAAEAEHSELRLVLDSSRPEGWRPLVALIDAAIRLLLALKVRLGAPRMLPATQPQAPDPQPDSAPGEWVTDARRTPNARPQMRVRMRVVR